MLELQMIDWIKFQVEKKPGVTTKWLFENRPRIGSQSMGPVAFEACLVECLKSRWLRTANKLWWPAGYLGIPKEPKPPRKKPDPRQNDFTKGST